MKKQLFLFILGLIFFSCSSKYAHLITYYNQNKQLHKELADGLMNFTKHYHTEVTLTLREDLGDRVILRYFLPSNNSRVPIEFDSLLLRNDPYPKLSSGIIVPIELIQKFKKMKYRSILADTSQVFFGFKYGADGNSHYGISIVNDLARSRANCIKRLSSDVCITSLSIP